MSATSPPGAFDQLGLEAPFADGIDETDRYEAGPAWNAAGESPYAEAPAAGGTWDEGPEPTNAEEENLAWLDMESESDSPQSFAEDLALDAKELDEDELEREHEHEHEHPGEWQSNESSGEMQYLDDEERDAAESFEDYVQRVEFEPELPNASGGRPTDPPALKRATIGGFGRYRSEAAALAPSERAKISALAAYVLWSFGPGRTPVRSIELVGHADRDAARGADFETTMSRERALGMRAMLAEAIDRQSAAHLPAEPPSPPISTRLHWRVVGAGAQQLLVPQTRTEAERARNRRVDIALHPAGAAPAPAPGLAFAAEDENPAYIEWTFPLMLRFSRIVPADINATNCCRAVQTASRLLEAAMPPKAKCASFNFFGSQLVTARDEQPPLSATRKCCQWSSSYWSMCRSEPHKSRCAHCGDLPGPHLVIKYAGQQLRNAVDRIKRALDQGCTVAAGFLSGICADKPEVKCALVEKDEAWRQCPEHWLLIIGYREDTFLFWDSSQASALQTREGHRFGLLEYDRDAPRLSTARSVAGAEAMVVDASGFHTRGYPSERAQKRYQVLDLRNSAPCSAWDTSKRCGEYTAEGRFTSRLCRLPVDRAREAHEAHEAHERSEACAARESEFHEHMEPEATHQTYFEPEDQAADSAVPLPAPLSPQQRAWILALRRSAIERLPDVTARARFLQQDWSDVEFPLNVPKGQSATAAIRRHWALARSLFDAVGAVTTERRVPASIRFRDRPAVKVPGQPSQRLYAEARDAFVRMHAAAKADGVDLIILSSWRSRARQAAASANQPNPAAVARKASAHMYGLAIDLRMGVPGLPVKEINTRVDRATAAKAGTEAKMGNLVRMYRSPAYKWMALRGREFGWYPYRNEPWHWEYNPPGLKERFESTTRGELEEEALFGESTASWEQADEQSPYAEAQQYEDEDAALSPCLRTFTAKALAVKVAVYVTRAARQARRVEMMVFCHGLDLCKPFLKNRPASFITGQPFKLAELVEATGRPIVLVVPFMDWERLDANRMAFGRKWHRLAQPANFNPVAAEALEQVRAINGSAAPPAVQRLILAGHSRAYGFFDALAHEHASPQMRSGVLACPTHVWALDTTYSAPIADWQAWLRSREDLQATVVFRQGTYRQGSAVRELGTGVRGKAFVKLAAASGGRLTAMPVAAGKVSHCGIPAAYLPRLLAALPALAASGEDETEAQWNAYEAYEEGEDEAGLATEAEASASEDEAGSGAWNEQATNEEVLETPDRFDALGDERNSEWGAQSSEEEQQEQEQEQEEAWHEDSFEESGHDLSFALDQEMEGGLAGSGLTRAEQKAVEITSLFETGKRGGFYGLSGNFDGQGLSFGLVNWTIGTGSLQPLLRDFAKEHPARWVSVFGPDASRFLQVIAGKDKQALKAQHDFAVEHMNSKSPGARGKTVWAVRQPWVGYFRRLSEDSAFQQIQVRYVRNLLARAAEFCRQFRLTSEQAFCFMFDAVASHGKWWLTKKFSGVPKRRVLVEQALSALATRFGACRVPESEVLLAIADVLATTSAQRWADKVLVRKRWFVTGQHPRGRELDGLMPRANLAYATSVSQTRESESDESDGSDESGSFNAGESELADDPQAILGKWIVKVKDWVWEYEFSPAGRLAWRDTRSNEKGAGRWSIGPTAIIISWSGSATTESWRRPLTLEGQSGRYQSSYYTGSVAARKVVGSTDGGAADAGPGRAIPPEGLTLRIDTASSVFDLGLIRMTKRHLFVQADLRIEPTTADVDAPFGFTLTPMRDIGIPAQPEQRGSFPKASMRWHNVGPSTLRWRYLRDRSPYSIRKPVLPTVVGTLTFTESDSWPAD